MGNVLPSDAQGITVAEIVKGATNQKDLAYSPNPIQIAGGDTVTWRNADTAAHTASSGLAGDNNVGTLFDSKIMGPKKEFSFTFTKAGTFDYFCQLHPTMVGKVIVGGNSPYVSISVVTDKQSYVSDETIIVSGNVSPIVDTKVRIQILNPEGTEYRSDNVMLVGAGDYSFGTKIEGPRGISGRYTVTVSYGGSREASSFSFTNTETQYITATADKPAYSGNDAVVIGGSAYPLKMDQVAKIQITTPANKIHSFERTLNKDGSYSVALSGLMKFDSTGVYKVLVTTAKVHAETSFYYAVLENKPSDGGKESTTLKTTASGRSGSTQTTITIANPQNSGASVAEFDVELPTGIQIKKLRLPKGWTSEMDGAVILFKTESKPIEPGKKLSFLIYASPTITIFDWTMFDTDGSLIDEGTNKVKMRKS